MDNTDLSRILSLIISVLTDPDDGQRQQVRAHSSSPLGVILESFA